MKTKLLGKVALFASVSLLTLQATQDASKKRKKKFLDQENHHSYLIKKSSYKESDSQSIQEQLDKEFQLYENKI
jgi:hypothetical protein